MIFFIMCYMIQNTTKTMFERGRVYVSVNFTRFIYPCLTSGGSVSFFSMFFLINLTFWKTECVWFNKEISFKHFSLLNLNSFTLLCEWFAFSKRWHFHCWLLYEDHLDLLLCKKKVTNENPNFWSEVMTDAYHGLWFMGV